MIASNCFKYNPPDHDVVAMAKKLIEVFTEKVKKMPPEDFETDHVMSASSSASAPKDLEKPKKDKHKKYV